MNEKLKELRGKLEERRKRLHDIFAEAGPDMDMSKVTSVDGDSGAKVDAIRTLNDEIDALAKEAEPLEAAHAELERGRRNAEKAAQQRPSIGGEGGPASAPQKSIGELYCGSEGYGRKDFVVALEQVDVKTLMQTSAGWEPESVRSGRLVDKITRPVQVIDIIPPGDTTQPAIVYMEETTLTNAAAEVDEGGTYQEAALGLTERSEPVRKIGVFLPVTDEQLDDEPRARTLINNRLPFMLRQRLDGQVVNGNGDAPNLSGFLDRSDLLTQAKGADPVPDAVYKALVKCRVDGRAAPDAILLNAKDWQGVRLLRTADGIYIWGSPAEQGEPRMWGKRVVEADQLPEGTGLVGDFAGYSELVFRKGIELKLTDSHADYFANGKQAIRADLRAALCVYRPQAFCEITGI